MNNWSGVVIAETERTTETSRQEDNGHLLEM